FWKTIAFALAGCGLLFIPAQTAGPLRVLVRDALRPGQQALDAVCREGRAWSAAWPGAPNQTGRVRQLEEALRSVRLANRGLEIDAARLREQLQKISRQQGWSPADEDPAPLVTARLIAARVLGEESAALWRERKSLGIGAAA